MLGGCLHHPSPDSLPCLSSSNLVNKIKLNNWGSASLSVPPTLGVKE